MQRTKSEAVALLGTAALLVGCRGATAIEMVIETDLPCEDVKVVTTAIRSGSLEDYEDRPVTAQTTRCDAATGRIGSLVLVPSDDDNAQVAVKIVTARKSVPPDRCAAEPGPDCIVAKRVLRFVPHESLVLPVAMRDVCAGVGCAAGETCLEGACVPAARDWEYACPSCTGGASASADAGAKPSAAPSSTPPPPSPPPPPEKGGKDGKGKDDGESGKD
jgi:hypothetical protein